MSCLSEAYITPEKYLAIERNAGHKSEYFKGEMFAMAGASPNHVLIVTNVASELRMQLKKSPCRVYSTNLRLKVSMTGLYVYPDVMVVCGDSQFDDKHRDTILNPTVIVEVLSESAKDYDKGRKFEHYRRLASLKDYILIAQEMPHIGHFVRDEYQWLFSETSGLENKIELKSLGCVLELAEVYDKVF